jgi:hypothetical protein
MAAKNDTLPLTIAVTTIGAVMAKTSFDPITTL